MHFIMKILLSFTRDLRFLLVNETFNVGIIILSLRGIKCFIISHILNGSQTGLNQSYSQHLNKNAVHILMCVFVCSKLA